MAWDISKEPEWTYQELPEGLVAIEAGTSAQYNTGAWRTERPIYDREKCTDCMLCWMHCPDSSVLVADKVMTGIDLFHCKGCGICVEVCRFDALSMMNEEDAKGIGVCEM
ncbi:MAG: 4Fe-4S binding protein [Coriobacteriia bacterium]|nr:4Fe-4S binding protein [Coriobacteriia bacterium]